MEIYRKNDVTLQVGNLKVLKNETNIPLIQLLDSPTTLIPGEPRNRVSHLCALPHPSTHMKLLCITTAASLRQHHCCAVLLQALIVLYYCKHKVVVYYCKASCYAAVRQT